MGGLAQQRSSRLGRDLCSAGAARSGHGGDDEAFDEGRRRQGHPVADGGVRKQVEGELGAEHRAAEIHEDDDAVRAVRPLDGLHDADGVGPEGRLVKSGRDLDRHRAAVQHLPRQRDGSACERAAVGDDDETDPCLGVGRRALARPLRSLSSLACRRIHICGAGVPWGRVRRRITYPSGRVAVDPRPAQGVHPPPAPHRPRPR